MEYIEKSTSWEAFLLALNQAVEHALPAGEPLGGVDGQIFGLPRSGTTLLYQLMARTGKVGYPSNIMAMFWKAPWVGARLQVHLAASKPTLSLNSVAGRTREPLDPHEFGYYWRYAHGHSANSLIADQDPMPAEELRRQLAAVHDVFGTPVVYKSFLTLRHLADLRAALPEMKFVATSRPLVDVAASLLRVRREIGVGEDDDFGLSPGGRAAAATVYERIAQQLVSLAGLWETATEPAEDLLVVDYGAMCHDPRRVVHDVLDFLEVADVTDVDELPRRLPRGRGREALAPDDLRHLQEALDRVRQRETGL